jgi:hypothetical protein
MSSLQKFHRRTNGVIAAIPLIGSEAPVAGAGFWLGTAGDGTSKMYVAPKSTEIQTSWGSYGTFRGVTSITDGLSNTNTLYSFGSAAHPAAYYCKTMTQGGYNTWYLPTTTELNTLYANKSATPFANNDAFISIGGYYWASVDYNAPRSYRVDMVTNVVFFVKKTNSHYVRAVRRA